MTVTGIEVQSRRPYLDGAPFGKSGAYEQIDAVVSFAVDPTHPMNMPIVDLDRAGRAGDGRVQFRADFCLLQPVDPARTNGRLLFDVLNRGRRVAVQMFNQCPSEPEPMASIDPGSGFLMNRGWTVAWCGWQWDVVRNPAQLGLEAPQALENGRPIPGKILVQFQPNEQVRDHLLADQNHQPYPTMDPRDPNATLIYRDWYDGPAIKVPRDRWQFAQDERGQPVESDSHVWIEGGFEPGRFYEVRYQTSTCPVVGTGLLAVRDTVAWLHHGAAGVENPAAGRIQHTYGFGRSQSGRFLRHFLYLGLNLDENRRHVFDGVLTLIAGARRGEFNHRYGQPSVQYTRSFGHLAPFSDDDQTDPLTGETDGLLHRQRALDGVPKLVAMNTASEYWRGDCSLLHTDLAGTRDIEPAATSRLYYLASTQHLPGELPLGQVSPLDGARGVHGFNVIDYRPLLRAALLNLDLWATKGTEPPPSIYPRLDDGTAVTADRVLDAFGRFPVAAIPTAGRLRRMHRIDLGPGSDHGIGEYPPRLGEQYPSYVASVDADGNETGGIRLPDVEVPLATYTGWNPRDPSCGGEGQIVDMQGSTIPFAATREERETTGDPRPSIGERYRDGADFLDRVRGAAVRLMARRYLLAEDVDLVVRMAAERYAVFSG